MTTSRRSLLKQSAAAAAAVGMGPRLARAADETVRIGVIYDLSGPFAAGGSVACCDRLHRSRSTSSTRRAASPASTRSSRSTPTSQSKADVAINEVERLISQEKVDIVNGVYSSAHAVPLAAKVEAQKKILWITTAVSTAVFKDKNLTLRLPRPDPFRPVWRGVRGISWPRTPRRSSAPSPKNVKVAIIHEDGPYGVGVAEASERFAKEQGMQVVLKEGLFGDARRIFPRSSPSSSAPGPTSISHAGYNPDITLFLRQAREAGLRFKMLVGNGAGYSQLDKLRATFGDDVDNFCNIDPVPAQLLDPKTLAPGLGDLIKIMVERYKAKTGATDVPPHCSMGFNQTWVLLNNVLPVAKQKYGGFDPGGGAQGGARRRHSAGRHHPGLWRQVLSAR